MSSNSIYLKKTIRKNILISFNEIQRNIDEVILNKLKSLYENKCIEDGFIKKDSINIIERSNGYLSQNNNLNNIVFNILFECDLCNPKKDFELNCKIVEVIKPGFIAELYPLSIIIPINLHNNKSLFKKYKENDTVKIRVLDSKFIKNESEIQVVGILLNDNIKKLIKINSNNEDANILNISNNNISSENKNLNQTDNEIDDDSSDNSDISISNIDDSNITNNDENDIIDDNDSVLDYASEIEDDDNNSDDLESESNILSEKESFE